MQYNLPISAIIFYKLELLEKLLLSELEKQSLFDRYSVEIVARKYFAEVRESRKSSHLDSIIKTANNYTHFLQPTRVHKSYENTIINILTHIIMKYYDPEILKFNVLAFIKILFQ